jgi:hypothetical protein
MGLLLGANKNIAEKITPTTEFGGLGLNVIIDSLKSPDVP